MKDKMPEDTAPKDAVVPTRERLATEIEALARAQHDEGLGPMIKRARAGYYDDYASPLATPCAALVADFRLLGYEGMARKAMDGRWDGTTDEAEAWAASQTDPEIVNVLKAMERP